MRRYGNMFRVMDCPDSAIKNRIGIVDLRMLSGNTAVHSDPLMWHVEEKAEIASIQIISAIFATVQISIPIRKLSEDMQTMLQFWISFMKKEKNMLQNQPICALEPQNLYPVVWTQSREKAILAVYSENRLVKLPEGIQECIIINGTKQTRMILETKNKNAAIVVKDCCGRILTNTESSFEGPFHIISVPIGGQIYWRK